MALWPDARCSLDAIWAPLTYRDASIGLQGAAVGQNQLDVFFVRFSKTLHIVYPLSIVYSETLYTP